MLTLLAHLSLAAASALLAPGAVALPPGVHLSAPFPEGTEFMVSCDYAPCTPAHKGTDDPAGINDHYALDLIRNQKGNGKAETVTTVLPGEVVYAGWGKHGRSIYGRLVMVQHPLEDGQSLVSFYAHLSKLLVQVGDTLPAKAPIGLMGGAAWGKDDKLAPHLHFGLHLNPEVRGGPTGGQAVFPEPIDGYTGLKKEQVLTAGDGKRAALYLVVDDESPGFTLLTKAQDIQTHRVVPTEREQYIYGTPECWTSPEGYGPESRFRSLMTGPSTTELASWEAPAPRAGLWQAQIFIPRSQWASASQARYRIEGPSGSHSCTINQGAAQGWSEQCAELLTAAQGADLRVVLESAELTAAVQRVGIDAVRFVWRGPAQSAD